MSVIRSLTVLAYIAVVPLLAVRAHDRRWSSITSFCVGLLCGWALMLAVGWWAS